MNVELKRELENLNCNDDTDMLINDDLIDSNIDLSNLPSSDATITNRASTGGCRSSSIINSAIKVQLDSNPSSTSSSNNSDSFLHHSLTIDSFFYSDNTPLTSQQLTNSFASKKQSAPRDETELEIIKSLEPQLERYNWSVRLLPDHLTILECKSCDFSLTLTNLKNRFKFKIGKFSPSTNKKSDAEISQLTCVCLTKLLSLIFAKHKCDEINLNTKIVFLIIKNFFKQMSKNLILNNNNNNQDEDENEYSSLLDTVLDRVRKKLDDYINCCDLTVINNVDFKAAENAQIYDAFNDDDHLLASLENLINDEEFDEDENNQNNNEDDFLNPIYTDMIDTNNDHSNKINANSSNNELQINNSLILKAINKRKLQLACPICSSCVVNMSDHLVKKHSIKDRNERKYLMDMVRRNYLMQSPTQIPPPQVQQQIKQIFNGNNNTNSEIQSPKQTLKEDTTQMQTSNASNTQMARKFVKCPICVDENKYFVNISDHLIKIHHLNTSEARKPILKQIKNSMVTKTQLDSIYSSRVGRSLKTSAAAAAAAAAVVSITTDCRVDNNCELKETESYLNETGGMSNEACFKRTNEKRKCNMQQKTKQRHSNEGPEYLLVNHDEESNDTITNPTHPSDAVSTLNLCPNEDEDYAELIGLNYLNDSNPDLAEANFLADANLSTTTTTTTTITNNPTRALFKRNKTYQPDHSDVDFFSRSDTNPSRLNNKKLKPSENSASDDLPANNELDVVVLNNQTCSCPVSFNNNNNSKSTTRQINPSNQRSNYCASVSSSVSSTSSSPPLLSSMLRSTNETTTSSNNNKLTDLWSKLNNMEHSLGQTLQGFNLLAENFNKQIKFFSTQFETALSEIDSLKKCLLDVNTITTDHNELNSLPSASSTSPSPSSSSSSNSNNDSLNKKKKQQQQQQQQQQQFSSQTGVSLNQRFDEPQPLNTFLHLNQVASPSSAYHTFPKPPKHSNLKHFHNHHHFHHQNHQQFGHSHLHEQQQQQQDLDQLINSFNDDEAN